MGRRGRKRKGFRREPNGRIQRQSKTERVEERVRIARNQPHRRGLKSNDRISELAESALGRLALRHLVSPGMRAAGEAFAADTARYRAVIEGPRGTRSLALAASGPSETEEEAVERFECVTEHADPIERRVAIGRRTVIVREWPCGQTAEGCRCAQRRARYMRAYEAIAQAGRAALIAVIRIAVRGEEPSSAQEVVNLKLGLAAGQRHYGLTDMDRAG